MMPMSESYKHPVPEEHTIRVYVREESIHGNILFYIAFNV